MTSQLKLICVVAHPDKFLMASNSAHYVWNRQGKKQFLTEPEAMRIAIGFYNRTYRTTITEEIFPNAKSHCHSQRRPR